MKTKRNLSASIPNETRKAVYARDGYRCALCDDTHGLQIHHIVHRSCGGNDTPCNLITLCWRCHAEAHGTWVAERHAVRPPHTASVCARPRPAETAGRGPHRLCPLTAPAAPASQMAASAGGKSLRARCGVPLRPPVPLLRRLARQRRRAAPPAGSRHPIFLEWWRLAPPGPLRRRRPVRRSCCGQPR